MMIALMVLGFVWWWPVGLVVLGLMLARRRFRNGFGQSFACAGDGPMFAGNYSGDRWERKVARAQEKVERVRSRMARYSGNGGGSWFSPSTSGNRAFDDYRSETLRRLEDEQREFKEFLDRLRVAKDRAEFDEFMAHRRRTPSEPETPSEPPAPHS